MCGVCVCMAVINYLTLRMLYIRLLSIYMFVLQCVVAVCCCSVLLQCVVAVCCCSVLYDVAIYSYVCVFGCAYAFVCVCAYIHTYIILILMCVSAGVQGLNFATVSTGRVR